MRTFLAFTVALSIASVAAAQIGADGYDFVTIGAVDNPAYNGPDPFNRVTGRGSVGYEYRIGRTEVTTAQWVEFFNAAKARPDALPISLFSWFERPIIWGGEVDTSYTGPGTRYRVRTDIPNAGLLPAGGISWRGAAVLCNWLHNGKSLEQSAFMNGAYDVSTFNPPEAIPTFEDQATHHPDAKYWIPTLDEWIKAAHFDPNGNNGTGRWWEQPNGTNTPLDYGLPPGMGGTGQANAGFTLPGNVQYQIPLGAYPNVQSPWGLLDVAGGTREWLEDIYTVDGSMNRRFDGSTWGGSSPEGPDLVWGLGSARPHLRSSIGGLRIASVVPAPSSALVLMFLGGMCVRRYRRNADGTHVVHVRDRRVVTVMDRDRASSQ